MDDDAKLKVFVIFLGKIMPFLWRRYFDI